MGKRVRSTSPAVGRTSRHAHRLTVQILIGGEQVEAIVDSGVNAPMIEVRIAAKWGI